MNPPDPGQGSPLSASPGNPTNDPGACGHGLAMRLRAAYLALHRRVNAGFVPFGLTTDQFVVLTVLADGRAITQKELVQRTASYPNTLSEILARLEHRGLVVRQRHAEDARLRTVSLSDKGRRTQRQMWQASEALHAELVALFPPTELDTLARQLDQIALAMTDPKDLPPQRTQ